MANESIKAKPYIKFRRITTLPCITDLNETVPEGGQPSYTWPDLFAERPSTYTEEERALFSADVVPVFSFSSQTPFSEWFKKLSEEKTRFVVQTKLNELSSEEHARWVATIEEFIGYRCRLRLLRTDPLPPIEFWVNLASSDVLPFGTEHPGKLLPLEGSNLAKMDGKKFQEAVMEMLFGQRTMPEGFENEREFTIATNRFKIGDQVEVLNRANPSEVRPAIVKDIRCGRMYLVLKMIYMKANSADDSDDLQRTLGIYLNQDSPLIFPVGWAMQACYPINADASYREHCSQILEDTNFVSADGFKHKGNWREGDALEVLDPIDKKFQSLCVAHVKRVCYNGYLELVFEKTSDTIPLHPSSPNLFPPGYAKTYGIKLETPKQKPGRKFDWDTYFKENVGLRLRPNASMFRADTVENLEERFKIGAKLEAADQVDARRPLCPATVKAHKGRLLLISFDGWSSEYDQLYHVESSELSPVGWSEMNGLYLHHPNISDKDSSRKRRGITPKRSRGAPKRHRGKRSGAS
ncbi:hypothetical protein L596_009359 [Steinernema carpocapsae]|uniref:SLED domain-containing protein n=1 Tax=Steinernema carpocapsae TaxID=34508 RepID=A0A4V6A6J4_STECR|nr:hypothetical protein L596_009359 [Steinernema carpocapsae]